MTYKLPEDIEMGSVYLTIIDLERSLYFYRDQLGFQVIQESADHAVLSADGEIPLIRLKRLEHPVDKPKRTSGLYHFAILLPERKALAEILKSFIMCSVMMDGTSDHQFSEALYLTDPDGHGVEIYADRAKKDWEVNEKGEYAGVTIPLNAEELLTLANQPWAGMPKGTKMGHVHLHVSDLIKSEQFYTEVLGFDPTIQMEDHAVFVSAGGYHHHLGLNVWNGRGVPHPPKGSIQMEKYTILLTDNSHLNSMMQHLNTMNIPFDNTDKGILIKDPAGQSILIAKDEHL